MNLEKCFFLINDTEESTHIVIWVDTHMDTMVVKLNNYISYIIKKAFSHKNLNKGRLVKVMPLQHLLIHASLKSKRNNQVVAIKMNDGWAIEAGI